MMNSLVSLTSVSDHQMVRQLHTDYSSFESRCKSNITLLYNPFSYPFEAKCNYKQTLLNKLFCGVSL